MKQKSVVFKVWFGAMLIVAFFLVTSALLFLQIYQAYIQDNYLAEMQNNVKRFERLVAKDPELVKRHPDDFLPYSSNVYASFYYGDKRFYIDERQREQVSKAEIEQVEQLPEVKKAVEERQNIALKDSMRDKNGQKHSFSLNICFFEKDGQEGAVFSYIKLDYIDKINRKLILFFCVNIFGMIIFSLYYFYFLKKKIGRPLLNVRNTAISYTLNDFRKKLPEDGSSEFAQLGIAMNRMGRSMEVTWQTVRQEKQMLSHVLYSMFTGVLCISIDNQILFANPNGEFFLQKWKQHANKLDRLRLFPETLRQNIDEMKENNSKKTIEINFHDHYYQLFMVPLKDDVTKEMTSILITIHDVTKEYQMEKTRLAFISNISHELRTPLAMIRGFSEAIIDDIAQSDSEKKEMAHIIYDETDRMNKMVEDMLDLNKIESGHVELNLDWVPLKAYFDTLKTRFLRMSSENHVEIVLELSPTLGVYYMDEDRISQVFINLVNNAIRYGISGKDDDQIIIKAYEDGENLVMSVADFGPGIPEKDIQYIFDRFYKVDKARQTQKDTGTGIGLSIVKKLVNAHGGQISYKENEPQGAIFEIRMPIKIYGDLYYHKHKIR